MKLGNSAGRWGLVSRLLHWFMAVTIIFMLGLGTTMINTRLSPLKLEMFMVHKSIGMLLLLAIIIRILWRLINPAPNAPSFFSTLQKRLVFFGQLFMYLLMLCIPISGWVINSAANFPLQWFGLFQIPAITDPSLVIEDYAKTIHLVMVSTLAAVAFVHIASALHHHWLLRNDVLRRML